MRAGGKLAAIVARHVDACVAELRAAVEAEIAAAVSGLQAGAPVKPRRLPQERAPKRARPSAPGSRKSKPVRSSRECGCSLRGRHRRDCTRDGQEPPQPVERSPRVPKGVAPVDESRAERFARIEAAAAKRNGVAT